MIGTIADTMKKISIFTVFLLVATLGSFAQKNSLGFLKGQNKLDVVINYDELMIQGIPESSYLEMNGAKVTEQWETAKNTVFKESFLLHLNRNLNATRMYLICGDYPDAPYQATVYVLSIGRNWKKITYEIDFTRKGDDTLLTRIKFTGKSRRAVGVARVGSKIFLTRTAFGYAGENLGKYMSGKINILNRMH
jgi:hypothetical protein